MDFQKIIEQVWPNVRSRHLFPELPVPEVAEEDDRSGRELLRGHTDRRRHPGEEKGGHDHQESAPAQIVRLVE